MFFTKSMGGDREVEEAFLGFFYMCEGCHDKMKETYTVFFLA